MSGYRVWGPALLLFAAGCASTVPLTVYQPRDTPGVRSFFRNGAAIGAIYGDSVFSLAQVEPVFLVRNGDPYARLWLLVENHSSKPMLIEPLKCAALHIESTTITHEHGSSYPKEWWKPSSGGRTISYKPLSLTPASPTKILATISNAQASAAILAGIGAALQAAAVQPTTATTTTANTSVRYETKINDVAEKRQAILGRSAAQMASTDSWFESFKNSVNQGVLRRNTLFPGEGVNGYIYFRVPSGQPRQPDRRYVVTLTLPEGEKVATFDPIAGE